jgi:hypothetical protein
MMEKKCGAMMVNTVLVHEYIIDFNLGARASHHTLVDCRQAPRGPAPPHHKHNNSKTLLVSPHQ